MWKTQSKQYRSLTVTPERESLVPLPGCPSWRSCLVVQVTLSSETSVLLPSRSESTKLPVLVDRLTDPVDPGVIADSIVGSIHQDYLKVLVSWILIDPVLVENLKATKLTTGTFLSNWTLAALEFKLSDTLVCRFTIYNTLGNWSLSSSTSYTHTINDITLQKDNSP